MQSLQIILVIVAIVLAAFAILLIVFGTFEYKSQREISKELYLLNRALADRYALIPKLIEELEIVASGNPLIPRMRRNFLRARSASVREEVLRHNQLLTITLGELDLISDDVSNDLMNDDFNILRAKISACGNRIYHHKQRVNDLILISNYRRKQFLMKRIAGLLRWKDYKFLVILPDEVRQ